MVLLYEITGSVSEKYKVIVRVHLYLCLPHSCTYVEALIDYLKYYKMSGMW